MPKKVKAARNKVKSKDSKKSSTIAAAIEKEFILGSVKTEREHGYKIGAEDACVCVPIKEECNYIFFIDEIENNDKEESEESTDFNFCDILSIEELAAKDESVTQL
jgi:hypothetical protein